MTFRIPFQIYRAVNLIRSCSPDKFLNKSQIKNVFQKNLTTTYVDFNNNNCEKCQPQVKQNIDTLNSYNFVQKRFKSTNPENRKKIRKLQKCEERKCEKKLVFRQTSRDECVKCVDYSVPDKCPKLKRLKPSYDPSKLKWKHKNCPANNENEVIRMDEIKGYRIRKKSLPKLQTNDCEKCGEIVPKNAPKLKRLKPIYDPSQLKWKHKKIECKQTECPPRMDDVRGYKIEQKQLPELTGGDDCEKCAVPTPKEAPALVPPKRRYDPSKLEKVHKPNTGVCNEKTARIDNILELKVKSKKLPNLLIKDECTKCVDHEIKNCPKLPRLKKKYDPSEMKWKHVGDKVIHEHKPPRMDNVLGYEVGRKNLPKLTVNKCEKCAQWTPKTAPKLVRPKKLFDETQMKWKHEPCLGAPIECPVRADSGYKVKRKKLPRLTLSKECTYCVDSTPTTAPELGRPKKLYDESEIEFKHNYSSDKVFPQRMDDVMGYTVTKKCLPELVPRDKCRKCMQDVPTTAPELGRPKRLFDPSQMLFKHKFCEQTSEKCVEAPRMDKILGYKVEQKSLPKLTLTDECPKCVNKIISDAPKLGRLKRKYDPSKMLWKHECPEIKSPVVNLRMDDAVGYCVKPKKLPTIPAPNDCDKCRDYIPKYAPKLVRPKKRYDPLIKTEDRKSAEDLCDFDPPRMDDVLCWKPKKKILPAFISSNQKRNYSTFTTKKPSFPVYSRFGSKNYKIQKYDRNYSKKTKSRKGHKTGGIKCSKEKKIKCHSFKLPGCKKRLRKDCNEKAHETLCEKIEAPYSAYTDKLGDTWETDPTECVPYQIKMLQPKHQITEELHVLKPPPPVFKKIDPSLERNCTENKAASCEEDAPKKDNWKNPCPTMKMKGCKPRARNRCKGAIYNHSTTKPEKLEPPYKSFTDKCPQFPEIQLNECELADKFAREQKLHYNEQDKKKHKKKKTDKCIKTENKCSKSKLKKQKKKEPEIKCKEKTKKVQKFDTTIDGKKYSCKASKIAAPSQEIKKTEKGKEVRLIKLQTLICESKDGKKDKQIICVCKPTPSRTSGKSAGKSSSKIETKSKSSSKIKPKSKSSHKIEAKSTTASKTQRSTSLPKVSCKPKGTGSKKPSKGCKKTQSKSKYNTGKKKLQSKSKCKTELKSKKSSGSVSCCGYKLSQSNGNKQKKKTSNIVGCKTPSPNPVKSADGQKSLWQKICDYFRARPNCPAPGEWKKKELREKAEKAAAAAGLEICKPSTDCNVITIKETYDKCEKKVSKKSKCSAKPKKSKTSSCCEKPVKKKRDCSQSRKSRSSLYCSKTKEKQSSDTSETKSTASVCCAPKCSKNEIKKVECVPKKLPKRKTEKPTVHKQIITCKSHSNNTSEHSLSMGRRSKIVGPTCKKNTICEPPSSQSKKVECVPKKLPKRKTEKPTIHKQTITCKSHSNNTSEHSLSMGRRSEIAGPTCKKNTICDPPSSQSKIMSAPSKNKRSNIAGPSCKSIKAKDSSKCILDPPQATKNKKFKSQLPAPRCNDNNISEPCPNLKSKNYLCTYVARNKYFSTRSDIFSRNISNILANQYNISTYQNLRNTSTIPVNNVYPYLTLSNKYIGKICKLKFTKIGLRNNLVKQKVDEPYTICHICKVVPRRKIVSPNQNRKINNFKINSKPEYRKTF